MLLAVDDGHAETGSLEPFEQRAGVIAEFNDE
jgi:hypothetical protein